MINDEKLFGNLFDEPAITPERLYAFGLTVLEALTLANGTGKYTAIIAELTITLSALGTEIGIVDTSLGIQLGKTKVVNIDMAAFKKCMSDNYPFIAKALGGKEDPRMTQFYPTGGITEYSRASQPEMETLTKRVYTSAGTNSVALGTSLTDELQAFYAPWVADKKAQTVQIKTVGDSRDVRNTNFINLGLDLTAAVHIVAGFNPGQVKTCSTFFKFSDLYAHGKQTILVLSGSIESQKVLVKDNRIFTDSMSIYIKNTSIDADCFAYLAAVSGDEPTTVGRTVKATKGTKQVPSKFGDLTNTFLSLKNMSKVNPLTFIIKIWF